MNRNYLISESVSRSSTKKLLEIFLVIFDLDPVALPKSIGETGPAFGNV
jgi:hypothetical protein